MNNLLSSCQTLSFSLLSLTICARVLEGIGKDANALYEKSGEAKFFDYRRDSTKVAKLVERLRHALLIYQVGIAASH